MFGVTAVAKNEITQADKETLDRISLLLANIRQKLVEVAPLFAKLSPLGLLEAKQRFRGLIRAEHIDRLVAYAKGSFPEHFACRCDSLRLNEYFKLKQSSRDILANPEAEIQIATNKGHYVRKVVKLNVIEMKQAFDPHHAGVVPVETQRQQLLKGAAKATTEVDDPTIKPIDEFRISVIKDTQYLMLVIDGQRYKLDGRKFRRQAKYFK